MCINFREHELLKSRQALIQTGSFTNCLEIPISVGLLFIPMENINNNNSQVINKPYVIYSFLFACLFIIVPVPRTVHFTVEIQ